ncbi:hypothetical protein Tco_0585966, partial [Tanacetum coccineum]
FSPNKTSVVYEKTSPRSDLRWKPTSRIFEFVGLRWIPTGKLFDSCTSKVDSEPPHGSNVDIPHIHECKQTLDSMVAEKDDISETIVKVDSQMMIQKNGVRSRVEKGVKNEKEIVVGLKGCKGKKLLLTLWQKQCWETMSRRSLNLPDHQDKTTVLQPHSSEVGFINHMLILKLSKAQVDQESQIKMIQVKEMMQDNDLKNSKSKDRGSRSRSQSMNDQSHYKQDKTITRQSINVKRHIFNLIGGTEEFEERDLNIGGDC